MKLSILINIFFDITNRLKPKNRLKTKMINRTFYFINAEIIIIKLMDESHPFSTFLSERVYVHSIRVHDTLHR